MKPTDAFSTATIDTIKSALAGGTLTVYSVARPSSADIPVDRSGVLATFNFASPAFAESNDDTETPCFTEHPVAAVSVGTPGFVRVCAADGTVVADLSAGPGPREVKFKEVSCSKDAPVEITEFRFFVEDNWPEKPEFYDTKPRTGYPMPKSL